MQDALQSAILAFRVKRNASSLTQFSTTQTDLSMRTNTANSILTLLLILTLATMLAACGGDNAAEETVIVPQPTWTPTATSVQLVNIDVTATPKPVDTPTPAPVQPTSTPTPAPSARAIITEDETGIYAGPADTHPRLDTAKKGEAFVITGKNSDGTWWQIDYNGQTGWLSGKQVQVEHAEDIAVAENIPTPPPAATPTPKPVSAKVIITAPQANLRKGPGTTHPKMGVVKKGQEFPILGKNKAGDWWQIDYNGKTAWVYNTLVRVENADGVKVAQNIPTPPPAPTRAPAPTATNTPPPPPPDPCASIGGDGCKWHIRSGPAFAPNGYGLKLTFGFVHGGRGDEPQGSYFVWLEKNGAKLPIPDSVRSWSGDMRQGPNGPYNYEYSVGTGDIPDRRLEGCYVGWVLDGNGERDSHNFEFCVPDGQGEVWILFDQS